MPVPHPAQIGSVRLQPDSQTVRWSGLAQLVQSSPSFCEQSAYQPIGARSSRSTTVRSVRVRWLSCCQASRCSGVPAIRPAGSTVRSDRGPGPSDSLLRRLCWLVEHSKEPGVGRIYGETIVWATLLASVAFWRVALPRIDEHATSPGATNVPYWTPSQS